MTRYTPAQYDAIIQENLQRLAVNNARYNPVTGEGSNCCPRVKVCISDAPIPEMYIPEGMLERVLVKSIVEAGSLAAFLADIGEEATQDSLDIVWGQFEAVRYEFDFEYWAYMLVEIKKKNCAYDIPFLLNRGQRRLLKRMYAAFLEGKPIRIILLKARQWGGSTLVQIFMIWIQLIHRRQWHSVICAHVENTAKIIRGMYNKLLKQYPHALVGGDSELKLTPFENSHKTRQLKERQCRITIGSAERPEGIRGDDMAMAHLSEVGLWTATAGKKPEDLVQSIVSGIGDMPCSMIVYESTAKGVGNFFHREWQRAVKKESGFDPVFVAWFDIELYQEEIPDYKKFIDTLSPKEMAMFKSGATLEGVAWYRKKKTDYSDEWRFISEYPSNALEAFQSTGRRFYPIEDVARLRQNCVPHIALGEVSGNDTHGAEALKGLQFIEKENGCLKLWAYPSSEKFSDRYVVVVDVSYGVSEKADNGVIAVFDRYWMSQGGVPEVVAEWVGHVPTHYLIWKSTQIAEWFQHALLVIESNTPENRRTEGFEYEAVLDEIAEYYDNLFCRTPPDKIKQGIPPRWGFHTNTSSKFMVCTHQQKALEKDMYFENSIEACDEHDTFEVKENGSLGAVEGCRDDRHITRAIGVWVCYQHLPPPRKIEETRTGTSRRIIGESTI